MSSRLAHQGSIVQFTVVQKLNQGERKKSAEIDEGDSRKQIKIYKCTEQFFSFLTFFVTFLCQDKKVNNKLQNF